MPSRASQNNASRTIRASEIGEYSYCSRAWWYRHVVKLAPPANADNGRLAAGTAAHHMHGRRVARALMLGTLGFALALLGIGAVLFAILNF